MVCSLYTSPVLKSATPFACACDCGPLAVNVAVGSATPSFGMAAPLLFAKVRAQAGYVVAGGTASPDTAASAGHEAGFRLRAICVTANNAGSGLVGGRIGRAKGAAPGALAAVRLLARDDAAVAYRSASFAFAADFGFKAVGIGCYIAAGWQCLVALLFGLGVAAAAVAAAIFRLGAILGAAHVAAPAADRAAARLVAGDGPVAVDLGASVAIPFAFTAQAIGLAFVGL